VDRESPPKSPKPYIQRLVGAEPVEGQPRLWRVRLSYLDRQTREQRGREAVYMHADVYRQYADEQKRGVVRLVMFERSTEGDGTCLATEYDHWVKTGEWPKV
jgi:hypothetical protein